MIASEIRERIVNIIEQLYDDNIDESGSVKDEIVHAAESLEELARDIEEFTKKGLNDIDIETQEAEEEELWNASARFYRDTCYE